VCHKKCSFGGPCLWSHSQPTCILFFSVYSSCGLWTEIYISFILVLSWHCIAFASSSSLSQPSPFVQCIVWSSDLEIHGVVHLAVIDTYYVALQHTLQCRTVYNHVVQKSPDNNGCSGPLPKVGWAVNVFYKRIWWGQMCWRIDKKCQFKSVPFDMFFQFLN
jgi:hypothetical protein